MNKPNNIYSNGIVQTVVQIEFYSFSVFKGCHCLFSRKINNKLARIRELPADNRPITINIQFSERFTKMRLKKAINKQVRIMGLWLIYA
ncbi:MAG: hypothetical protein B7Y76_11355, partial [Sphingobacteriia bacterium 35-40-5]